MDKTTGSLNEYYTRLVELLGQGMQWLAALLGDWGVPEAYRQIGALGVVYLAVTLTVAIFILLLLRIGRKKRPVPVPKAPPEAVEPIAEAEPEAPTEEPPVAEPELEEPVAEQPAVEVPELEEPKPAAPPVEGIPEPAAPAPLSLFDRMRAGLAKTQNALVGRIDALLRSRKVDAELLEDLEEILIAADFGMQTTMDLIQSLQQRLDKGALTAESLREALQAEIRQRLEWQAGPLDIAKTKPFVLMVVGVNGVGKTTTIGKLARQFTNQGLKVVLGAGDTFRAAAADQLAIWGERSGVDVIRHAEGADPAAVAFDAAKAAVARKADVLILDTAGRLHTKVNLMEEMKKIHRVLAREIADAPHETLLVLDATTGQNALIQARLFKDAVKVSGIALTKLDGTAKGGMVVAIGAELGLPVRYVGIGEGAEDLRPFEPDLFVQALFKRD